MCRKRGICVCPSFDKYANHQRQKKNEQEYFMGKQRIADAFVEWLSW